MPISLDRLRSLGRIVLIAADTLVALALVATAALLWLEHGWVQPKSLSPEEAFNRGTIGTELMPLVVAQVLPDMYPQHFQPGGAGSGPWCEQFGFLPTQSEGCKDLPLGFAISSYRPGSGAPSPVPFVGFSCALCHTTELHGADGTLLDRVPGPGNTSLNLFAWLDALQAAVLDRTVPPGATPNPAVPPPYTLTVSRLSKAYGARMHRSLGAVEKLMVMLWLDQFRTRLTDGLPRFDDPYGDGRSRDPDVTPTGPLRTQPFRTLVRQVLDRPGDVMAVYTKIATVFSEGTRTSAQFDGSITDLYARSAMAAFAAGATVENMKLPEIANNIRRATDYTKSLHPHKTFAEYFPDSAERSPERLAQGREVYRRYCFSCHGDWEGAAWSNGPRTGEVVPLAEIGTDPERVMFRHYGDLPERLYLAFPPGHPFHFARDQMRPSEADKDNLSVRGYVAAPIDGAFLRAPYLHNASVLTLAELINLEPRRPKFYRGVNRYDPRLVGYASPDQADASRYFEFDTGPLGNRNTGHDYPWRFDSPDRDPEQLRLLLDYLKTL